MTYKGIKKIQKKYKTRIESLGPAGDFAKYFDDLAKPSRMIKKRRILYCFQSVDIPQESALKACLSNGDATGKKVVEEMDEHIGLLNGNNNID